MSVLGLHPIQIAFCVCCCCCCCWSLLYSAILRSRADSLRSHVILHEWIAFYSAFWNIRRSGVLTTLAWLVPHETAAISASSVYTIQPRTMSLHAKPHTWGVCVFSCILPPALLAECLLFSSIRCRYILCARWNLLPITQTRLWEISTMLDLNRLFQCVTLKAWFETSLPQSSIYWRSISNHCCLFSSPADQWCDVLGVVPADHVSSSSTLQISRDESHLYWLL